jgi:hypothetical protein
MTEIQYCDVQSRKLKEQIFSFMEDNLFAIVRVEAEIVIYYNGLKVSKNRNVYSIKDTNCYNEVDNLFILKMFLTHLQNAVKSKEITEAAEYNRTMA